MSDQRLLARLVLAGALFAVMIFATGMVVSGRYGGIRSTGLEFLGMAAACYGVAYAVDWALRRLRASAE